MKGLHQSYAGHCNLSKVWWIFTHYVSSWLYCHLIVMGFLYADISFIISVFKISGNSCNLTSSKLMIDNFEKQNCVNKTVPV